MIRNPEVLGLTLAAMLTMAAEFHSEATNTNLSGAQEGTNTFITYHESGFACKNSGSSTTGGQFNGTWRWTGLFVGMSFGHFDLTVE